MEQEKKKEIAKRLMEQKEELHTEYREKGFRAGQGIVDYFDYETLLFIKNVVVPNGVDGRYNSCSNSDDTYRDYLNEIIEDDDFLLDEEIWDVWSDGWIKGFLQAWLEIKAEL
ncbi:hypothetical protein DSCW_01080 [Desulfosarcina widdelii]|uniref:Uncharacterized protein n=1 Tax=Desulfosarcina widdelii TaxID=947919 RepID=A0A5K7YZT1_9BACT|nr:hypothetical protein [Desulfosarcina widdelii]BBO72691.1 hypothetical protein DSCW_01080 [Desulfosarcina widdelii]